MSPITTHVLDTARGRPAEGLAVVLERREAAAPWVELARGLTDADGRCGALLPHGAALTAGTYRLRFATAGYFDDLGVRGFYPEVQVVFQIDDPAGHYHVPLLLSPYGYSTYRGS
jgi:5-hydroxyisourate hydrolase